MKTKNSESRIQRVDKDFIKDMRDIGRIRVIKRLADPFNKTEYSLREITRLIRRTDSYPRLLEELKTKPVKKK